MSIGRLVFKNVFKHPIRTLLTILSVFVAVFLLIVLRSFVTTMEDAVKQASTRRIVTSSAVSLFVALPQSYLPKIQNVDGVEMVSRFNWFGGYVSDPSNFFAQFACDPELLLQQYPECRLTDQEKKDFFADRQGAIIGAQLARNRGWKVGDRIPVTGTIYPHRRGAWELNVRGIYSSAASTFDENTMYFHFDYLAEARRAGDILGVQLEGSAMTDKDTVEQVGVYLIKVREGFDLVEVSRRIDELFLNGPARTRTETEAAFNQGFIDMLGDIPFLLLMIGLAVLFAVSLTIINAMLIAARERLHDVGVLKALGFSSFTTGTMFAFESMIIAIVGGAPAIILTIATAKGFADQMAKNFANFAAYRVKDETAIAAVFLTLGIGLIGGLIPAINATRLKVVDALRTEV